MEYKQYTYSKKKQYFNDLILRYTDNGTIDWQTFSADQSANKEKVVLLTNNDFLHGTLRVHEPCMLKFTESVQFNPNRPKTWLDNSNSVVPLEQSAVLPSDYKIDPNRELDWFPNSQEPNNSQYFENDVKFAYGLGFFAAVTVETSNVVINLNGYTLAQHKEHALQQRFYANIELADQPFIPFQGPSNFGSVLRSARNTYIFNGRLGLSSHHGIHGNDGDELMMEDVSFDNFEVAAFAINGFKNVYLKNLVVAKNRQDIPVLGSYSAGRFIRLFVNKLQNVDTTQLDIYTNALNEDLNNAFNSIINGIGSTPQFFVNSSGVVDGNPYGVVINPKGVAVNEFLENRKTYKANETCNVYMINCNINDIAGDIKEIIALGNPNGGVQVDTAGSVLQFFNGVSVLTDGKYHYAGTSLSNVQIELAKIKKQNLGLSGLGTLNIHDGVVDWKDNPQLYFKVEDNKLKMYDGNDNPYPNESQYVYNIVCNGDSMHHVNKGVIGLRIDGVNKLYATDLTVTNITNISEKGSELGGNYTKSHSSQGSSLVGYQGTKTYGVVLSAVNDVVISNLQVDSVSSTYGSSCGMAVNPDSNNLTLDNIKINNIESYVGGTYTDNDVGLPNENPVSKGLYVGTNCFNVNCKNINVTNIRNSVGNPYHYDYMLNSFVNMSN